MSTSPKAELIAASVAREREWMHARWMERMSFHQIAAAAALPVERGGLGIHVSPAGVKAMVHAQREAQGDLTMSREERRERMSDELDMRARAARHDLDKAYAMRREAEAWLEANPYAEPAERVSYLKMLEACDSTIDRADRRLHTAQDAESKLHGLAAPTEITATVTHRDAILDELNAELVALGEEPVEA